MRFGGPVPHPASPEAWIESLRARGYRTAYWPMGDDADSAPWLAALEAADITLAEIGVWNNVLDPREGRANIEKAKRRLALADRLGARCAVNISGSLSDDGWDRPFLQAFTADTFDAVVRSVREIIDDVRPVRAKYALETMPYMVPDSIESSQELVRAVDRAAFALHFDPVNLMASPRRLLESGAYVRAYVEALGPHIAAVHLKDVRLQPGLTVQMPEVRPGLGHFDIAAALQAAGTLDPDLPVLLEHLPSEDEYALAAAHVREVAASVGLAL